MSCLNLGWREVSEAALHPIGAEVRGARWSGALGHSGRIEPLRSWSVLLSDSAGLHEVGTDSVHSHQVSTLHLLKLSLQLHAALSIHGGKLFALLLSLAALEE